jgi:hypothetical protein
MVREMEEATLTKRNPTNPTNPTKYVNRFDLINFTGRWGA